MHQRAAIDRDPRTIASYKVAMLDQRGVGAFIDHALELPTMPFVATRILRALQDPSRGPLEIARLVEGDPGLAARILRVANSSLYGRARQVVSVQQAMDTIGHAEAQSLIIALATRALYRGQLDDAARRLWQHSVACAAASHVVATRYAPKVRNMAFVAGQVHDIGRIVMLRHDPQAFMRVEQSAPDMGLLSAERAIFGYTHVDAGAFIMRRWTMPAILERIAYHHHAFTRIGPETHEWAMLNACVIVGDFLCEAANLGGESEPSTFDRDVAPALDLLDIPDSHVDALIKGFAQAWQSEHDFFN